MKREKFILYMGAALLPIRVLAIKKKVTLLDAWNNLTEQQKAIRDLAWDYGERYGFEKTLTAIAWQESSFGLPGQFENPTEPSGGIFGNGYTTAARRHFDLPITKKEWVDKEGILHIKMVYHKPNKKQTTYVRDRLKVEPLFSAHHAILQLKEATKSAYFIKHLTGIKAWQYIWAYYNGGTNCMKEPLAVKYAGDILAKIKVMNGVSYNGN